MALIDHHETVLPSIIVAPKSVPLPVAVMEKLSRLQAENARTLARTVFLRTTVNVALGLMLLGVATLLFAAGTSLKFCFIWSALVLLGVGALLRCHIQASGSEHAELGDAIRDMRAVLLYAGFAWGAGALLVLPSGAAPAAALGFVVLPSLAVTLLLQDRDGALAFLLPLTAISLAAAILHHWLFAGLDTGLLLMLQSGIAAYAILGARRRETHTAGYFLRS
jgi:hypothetical protein